MDYSALLTIGSILAVSLVSLAGVFFLSLSKNILSRIMHIFVGLAAGALLGDAFVHLIPEVFESNLSALPFSISILAGIFIFFVLEKYVRWHHHTHESVHTHAKEEHTTCAVRPVGRLVLIGDGVHNFIDGAVIAASFSVSPALGIATTAAVFLHEIPQEISDFALLLHAGYSRARALMWNFISALSAIFGAVAFFIIGEGFASIEPVGLAFTAGAFIYIAAADLIPELHETKHPRESLFQLIAFIVGIGLMFALLLVE